MTHHDIMPINTSTLEAVAVGVEYSTPAYDIEHEAEVVYFQGFGGWATTEGWVAAGSGSEVWPLGASLDVFNVAEREITGLAVGADYTFSALVYFVDSPTVSVGVVGVGSSPPTGPSGGSPATISYTFTATSTSHTFRLDGGGEWLENFWDDVTLTRDAYTQHVPEVTDTDYPLEVKSADVTLDEARAPYCEAVLVCALPPEDVLEQIDPRQTMRVEVTAAQEWLVPADRAPQSRTFDLLLHEREVVHESGELRLILVSDEALLIDGGNDTDTPTRTYGVSVKDAVEFTLDSIGAALEAGAEDAEIESAVLPAPVVNLAPSPIANLAANWEGHGSTTDTLLTNAFGSSPALRSTRTTGSGAWATYLSKANHPTLVDGVTYTVRLMVRSSVTKAGCLIRTHTGTSTTALDTATFDMVAGVWVEATLTFTAQTARMPYSFSIYRTADSSGTTLDVAEFMIVEGSVVPPYFDGSTADTDLIEYSWNGTANASASTMTYLPNSDMMIWEPGVTAWDYVAPIVQAGGLRLFCDEQRRWYLVDPTTYSVPGQVNVAEGKNVIVGTDTISRQREESWYDAVVVKYEWTDAENVAHVAYDAASNGGTKLLRRVYDRPYPGPGAAAFLLAWYTGRGRTLDLTVLTDLAATPGKALVATLPDTPLQVGVVSRVTFGWAADGETDEMRLGSRGVIDTPETAWVLQPEGYAWSDVPTDQAWNEYETPEE